MNGDRQPFNGHGNFLEAQPLGLRLLPLFWGQGARRLGKGKLVL
jgi:hypothetical protein